MEKQKQIDKDINVRSKMIAEMAKEINKGFDMAYTSQSSDFPRFIASVLVEKYQPKIPEGAVVVPDMADKDFYTIEKTEWDKMVQGAKDIIHEREEKAVLNFAEKIKSEMKERDYMGVKYKQGVFTDRDIDEIAKEFTENKNEKDT